MEDSCSDGPDPPEAVVVPRSRLLPELIWAIPIVAALIGGWLAVRAIRAHGPTITISFRDAGGLVAGKTKIKYRDVEVGEVRGHRLQPRSRDGRDHRRADARGDAVDGR